MIPLPAWAIDLLEGLKGRNRKDIKAELLAGGVQ